MSAIRRRFGDKRALRLFLGGTDMNSIFREDLFIFDDLKVDLLTCLDGHMSSTELGWICEYLRSGGVPLSIIRWKL